MAAQQASASVLPGRARDLEVLEGALADARGGRPRVVIVEGVPGMGKTTLLDAFLSERTERAGHVRVTCDRFEQDVAYGVAGLLLAEPPDPMVAPAIVGRQLIAWLGSLQQDTGTGVLAVDDAQWMDRPSVDALRFALRRLRADRILAILARRPTDLDDLWASLLSDTGSVRRQRLGALTAADVTALARADRGGVLSAATAERLVRHKPIAVPARPGMSHAPALASADHSAPSHPVSPRPACSGLSWSQSWSQQPNGPSGRRCLIKGFFHADPFMSPVGT